MLVRYEGINESIDANFVKDYNDTTMHCICKNREDVAEVRRCIKMQLQVPCKAFTTVDALCDHLELCSMMTIIAEAAKQGCRAGAAWQLAENQIIACVCSTCQLSLEVITNAMTLAGKPFAKGAKAQVAHLPISKSGPEPDISIQN
eukprot:1872273-Rhodomonas_salina.1